MKVYPGLEIKLEKVYVIHLEVLKEAMLISFVSFPQRILTYGIVESI